MLKTGIVGVIVEVSRVSVVSSSLTTKKLQHITTELDGFYLLSKDRIKNRGTKLKEMYLLKLVRTPKFILN